MGFDPLVTHPGRLSILAVLAGEGGHALEFVRLRGRTRLTDGNLAAHAKRLRSGGLIRVEKQFEAGKPITRFRLTDSGRRALEEHVRRVTQAIAAPRGAAEALDPVKATASDASQVAMSAEEEWVD